SGGVDGIDAQQAVVEADEGGAVVQNWRMADVSLEPGDVGLVADLQRPRTGRGEVVFVLDGEEDVLVPEAGERALEDLAVAPMEGLGLVVGAGTRQQANSTERHNQSHADQQRGKAPQQSHSCLPFLLRYRQVRGPLETGGGHLSDLGRMTWAGRPTVPGDDA